MGGDGGWCRTLLVSVSWTVDEGWLSVVFCNGGTEGSNGSLEDWESENGLI